MGDCDLNKGSLWSYGITCIQRPIKGINESGLLQQVVIKCRFYWIDLWRVVVSEQLSHKAGSHLIQGFSNTGLTVFNPFPNTPFWDRPKFKEAINTLPNEIF